MGRHGRMFGMGARPLDEDPRPIKRATVRRVVDTFKPYKRRVAFVGVLIVITAGLGVVNPLLIRWIFNEGLFGKPPPMCEGGPCPQMHVVYVGVIWMILIPIITSVIGVGQTYYANLVGLRVMQDLRDSLYAHLQRMALRFFTNTRTGEIQSRLANDVGGVQEVVTDTASSILSNVVIVISTLIAMVILSWQLTVLSLAVTPIFLYFTARVGRARRRVAAVTQESLAEMSAITQETLSVSGILLAKVFGRQRYEIGRFRDENQRLADLEIRQQMVGRYFFALIGTFFSITPALVYLVAGVVISHQGIGQT